jgi:hypothetical protein
MYFVVLLCGACSGPAIAAPFVVVYTVEVETARVADYVTILEPFVGTKSSLRAY